MRALCLVGLLVLAGCGEPASTYDPKRGRYVSTEEYHTDHSDREISRSELERERR